uniref:Uncharacterized protein n=1 Tax=Lepeophtheirus salmonis TaxID=72036 RepID=A0A0K2TYT3_LEPSM
MDGRQIQIIYDALDNKWHHNKSLILTRNGSSSSSSSITTPSYTFPSIDSHPSSSPYLLFFTIQIYVNNNHKQIAWAPNSLFKDLLLSLLQAQLWNESYKL